VINRSIEPEWLDALPSENPGAIGSRRDLQRLNAWMGNARIVARALTLVGNGHKPAQLVEVGAGDGTFLLEVVRRLPSSWGHSRATLVERQNIFSVCIAQEFAKLGWELETIQADVFDWCDNSAGQVQGEIIIANLFLHHFAPPQLAYLLCSLSRRAQVVVSVEPRRSLWSLVFSRMVGIIGCNPVTQHDAPASVRAGFKGRELSEVWPRREKWSLREHEAGAFSHLFVATRLESRFQAVEC